MLTDNMKKSFIGRIVCMMFIATSSACVSPAVEELTFASPYAEFIGAEYRVVGDVIAHGIYENLNQRVTPSYITVVPGVGFTGPEVAFRKPIAKGQHIQILSAWRVRQLLSWDVYYLVTLKDATLPADVPIRIELSRSNEGMNAGLNPALYERLPKQ